MRANLSSASKTQKKYKQISLKYHLKSLHISRCFNSPGFSLILFLFFSFEVAQQYRGDILKVLVPQMRTERNYKMVIYTVEREKGSATPIGVQVSHQNMRKPFPTVRAVQVLPSVMGNYHG